MSRSGGILATSILALSAVIIFIVLRFITRIWLVKRVGWDDWCIVFAGVRFLYFERLRCVVLSTPSSVTLLAWALSLFRSDTGLGGQPIILLSISFKSS